MNATHPERDMTAEVLDRLPDFASWIRHHHRLDKMEECAPDGASVEQDAAILAAVQKPL